MGSARWGSSPRGNDRTSSRAADRGPAGAAQPCPDPSNVLIAGSQSSPSEKGHDNNGRDRLRPQPFSSRAGFELTTSGQTT